MYYSGPGKIYATENFSLSSPSGTTIILGISPFRPSLSPFNNLLALVFLPFMNRKNMNSFKFFLKGIVS
jgi:hypothetical protein